MKKLFAISLLLFAGIEALACVTCNRPIQQAIANTAVAPMLLEIFLPFIAIGFITAYLYYQAIAKTTVLTKNICMLPYATAFTVIGIGMGGFIDGIVLHQVLQWHEMLSNKIPPVTVVAKSVNMFWDGIFHLFTFAVTITGIFMLFKLIKRRESRIGNKLFSGGLLLGWGIFNLVEGLLNHHIFKLHHVRDLSPNYLLWDYGFSAVSIIMVITGWVLIKKYKVDESEKS